MASAIQTYLNNILNAVYGRDVRSSIHDAIELCYDDVTTGKTTAEAAAETVTTATTAANNAANAANAAASEATSAASAANTAATSATSAASEATNAASAANTAASTASNAATSAATSATNAASAAAAANDAVASANEAITAANEAIAIIETIDIDTGEALQVIADARTATTAANNAATAATTAANNATNAATAADNAASSCTSAITSANLAATNANAAKDAANTATSNVNNARDAANTAASNANTAASSAANAAANANAAVATANAKITAMDTKLFDIDTAINSASTAALSANSAATSANTAAAIINNLTVDYEDVGPNIPASAVLQTIDGHRNIHFLLRQGASGASFIIKGDAYATVEALQQGVPNPEVGDQYNVGSNPPYHIYRWTGSRWEDQGTIGSESDPITAQDVQAIQNGREIEGASTKVMKVEALTYLIHTLIANALDGKVNKVTGKGLSTNDFTNELASSLTNVISTVGTLSSSKVDKVTGKGLSTNDFTNDLLNKVVSIGEGALATTATTIIAAINELNTAISSINTTLTTKAPTVSPTFTGSPVATTPPDSNNSTRIATTAYVQNNFAAKANIYVLNVSANSWTNQSSNATYSSYPYRAALTTGDLANVTSTMFAMVVFDPDQVTSGNYAPVCQTYDGGVYVYSKTNTSIVIPTIAVFK